MCFVVWEKHTSKYTFTRHAVCVYLVPLLAMHVLALFSVKSPNLDRIPEISHECHAVSLSYNLLQPFKQG